MNSHELAEILLNGPNLPVATHACNNTYLSGCDERSHGELKVGLMHTYGGDHIVIGDISKRNLNGVNWYITKMIHGEADWEWPHSTGQMTEEEFLAWKEKHFPETERKR